MNSEIISNPEIISMTPDWLVVSKPSGWLTIPATPGNQKGPIPVLSEWLRKEYSSIWIVHRLDLETSGIVLFARHSESHQRANQWFQQRKVKKTYFCISHGVPQLPLLKIKEPIRGASALTQVEVKESAQEGFFARVSPQTGRRHQIRIHLSQNGFPIWGDTLYGGKKEILLGSETLHVKRVALHAGALQLPSGEKYEADLPADFKGWLETLRSKGTSIGPTLGFK